MRPINKGSAANSKYSVPTTWNFGGTANAVLSKVVPAANHTIDDYLDVCFRFVIADNMIVPPPDHADLMAARNITDTYPPILMIHGTDDTDVPHEQSLIMAGELKRQGLEYQLISVKDGEHGLGGGSPEDIKAAHDAVLPFIEKYMK